MQVWFPREGASFDKQWNTSNTYYLWYLICKYFFLEIILIKLRKLIIEFTLSKGNWMKSKKYLLSLSPLLLFSSYSNAKLVSWGQTNRQQTFYWSSFQKKKMNFELCIKSFLDCSWSCFLWSLDLNSILLKELSVLQNSQIVILFIVKLQNKTIWVRSAGP